MPDRTWKKGKWPWYLPLISTILIPGSGYVFLGRSIRGLVMLFWMIISGYLTFHFSSPGISFIGRISGGIAVWILSVAEVYRISRHSAGLGKAFNGPVSKP